MHTTSFQPAAGGNTGKPLKPAIVKTPRLRPFPSEPHKLRQPCADKTTDRNTDMNTPPPCRLSDWKTVGKDSTCIQISAFHRRCGERTGLPCPSRNPHYLLFEGMFLSFPSHPLSLREECLPSFLPSPPSPPCATSLLRFCHLVSCPLFYCPLLSSPLFSCPLLYFPVISSSLISSLLLVLLFCSCLCLCG